MANIRLDIDTPISDGQQLIFRSPVDCSSITGLIVYYVDSSGSETSHTFQFADAHGNDVGDLDHLFASDVLVKVILDVEASRAYVQNADTNKYLEDRIDRVKKEVVQRMTQAEYDALEYVDPHVMYVIEDAVPNTLRIFKGTYTGTGTFGKDNPNTLNFPFEPQIVIVCDVGGSSSGGLNNLIMVNPASYASAFPDDNRNVAHLTWGDKSVSWWVDNTGSTDGSNALKQGNGTNQVYHYTVIG